MIGRRKKNWVEQARPRAMKFVIPMVVDRRRWRRTHASVANEARVEPERIPMQHIPCVPAPVRPCVQPTTASLLSTSMAVSVATTAEYEDEIDIGLSSLSLPSDSPNVRPRALARPPGSMPAPLDLGPNPALSNNAQLRSPSSPNLTTRALPSAPPLGVVRKLSRSNTLPRRPHTAMHRTRLSLDGLAMGPEKVANLRRWIQGLVTGE